MSPASTPHYQSRPLPRPDDDLPDQGLGFDVETLLTRQGLGRRRVLGLLGLGGLGVGLAACGVGSDSGSGGSSGSGSAGSSTSSGATAASGSLDEIPDETAGPYPGDGSNGPDVLEESGIVRQDIRSSFGDATGVAAGVPITLELTIRDLLEDAPFAGVAVYVWHCDREGRYSMYTDGAEDENYLRGVQIADADGMVSFTSIFPACYSGRWPHIHFEVYPDRDSITDVANAIATSQVALPQDVCDVVYATDGYDASVANLAQVTLDGDNVFGDDGGALQLATVTGSVEDGYTVRLTVGIDTDTEPTGGSVPGGGSGPQGSPPPGA